MPLGAVATDTASALDLCPWIRQPVTTISQQAPARCPHGAAYSAAAATAAQPPQPIPRSMQQALCVRQSCPMCHLQYRLQPPRSAPNCQPFMPLPGHHPVAATWLLPPGESCASCSPPTTSCYNSKASVYFQVPPHVASGKLSSNGCRGRTRPTRHSTSLLVTWTSLHNPHEDATPGKYTRYVACTCVIGSLHAADQHHTSAQCMFAHTSAIVCIGRPAHTRTLQTAMLLHSATTGCTLVATHTRIWVWAYLHPDCRCL